MSTPDRTPPPTSATSPAAPKRPARRRATNALETANTAPLTLLLPSGPLTVPAHAPASGVGVAAHLLIALLAPVAPDLAPRRVVHECFALANSVIAPSRMARLHATFAAGFAVEYLRDLRPAAPWEVLGSEYDCGSGRVDVAYRHAESGNVLFDEVKTTHVPTATLDKGWLGQAVLYAQAGRERFGESMVGCRIVPLGSRHLTSVVLPSGRVQRIAPTVHDPLAKAQS